MGREQEISDTIAHIYEAGFDAALWPRAIVSAATLVGGHAGTFQIHRRAERIVQSIAVAGSDASIAADCFAVYQFDDPWVHGVYERIRPNVVLTGDELSDRRRFETSAAYNETYKKADLGGDGMVLPFLVGEDNAWASLNSSINKPQFTEEDRRMGALLLPHFRRALGFQERLGASFRHDCALEAALDRLSFPIFILDLNRRVLFANAATRAAATLWGEVNGVFRFREADAEAALRAALEEYSRVTRAEPKVIALGDAMRSAAVVYPHAHDVPPFHRLTASRFAILYLPSVTGPRPRFAALLAARGLTPAEIAMAEAFVDGDSLAGYAERHALSVETARWRCKALFAKFGVGKQAHLMRALLALAAVSGGDTRGR